MILVVLVLPGVPSPGVPGCSCVSTPFSLAGVRSQDGTRNFVTFCCVVYQSVRVERWPSLSCAHGFWTLFSAASVLAKASLCC